MNKYKNISCLHAAKTLATTLFLGATLHSVAATTDFAESNEVQTPELSGISAKEALKTNLQSLAQFSSGFTQVVSDHEGNIVHQAEGVITMSRPNKFRWETTFPDESLVIADGETVYSIDSFVEQVTLLDQASTIADNPIVLLTSNDDSVWSKFDVNAASSNAQSYEIVPQNQNGQIKGLTIEFTTTGELHSIVMFDAQLQQSAISFTNALESSVSPDVFTVHIPEHYVVDDQR